VLVYILGCWDEDIGTSAETMSLAICRGFLCHLSTMLLIMSTCSGGMPKEDSLSDSDGESSTEIAGVSCWGSILCDLDGCVFRVLGTNKEN
jgi:hypothetical protein